MEFSIKLHTIKSGLVHCIYTEGPQVSISKYHCISFFEDPFCFKANSADSDEMPHYVAFHLCLHCLQKYLCRGLRTPKG